MLRSVAPRDTPHCSASDVCGADVGLGVNLPAQEKLRSGCRRWPKRKIVSPSGEEVPYRLVTNPLPH